MLKKRDFAITVLTGGAILFAAVHFSRHASSSGVPGPGPASSRPQIQSQAGPVTPGTDTAHTCDNIYHLICNRRGEIRDPTGTVSSDAEGEILALREYEEIIHEHQDWKSEEVDEELVRQIYSAKNVGRVQAAFRWVRHAIEQFIDRQPLATFNLREKRQLKRRIREVKLELPPPVSVYADEPDLFTKNDVLYERTLDGTIRMRIGGAYLLSAKSWFNLVFTIAHEFAHSIDPCEIRAQRWSFPAYDRLSACFVDHGLTATRSTRRECGADDQLSETFADWVAVKVTSVTLKNYATEFHGTQILNAVVNSVRDLCDPEESLDSESETHFHPSPRVRINRIFGRNPEIRQVLGCLPANNPEYCSFEWRSPERHLTQNSRPTADFPPENRERP